MQSAMYPLSGYEPRYQTIRWLGQGGFGHVYLVKNTVTGEEIAEKRVELQYSKVPQTETEYMQHVQEGPNIAQVYGSEMIGTTLYIRMKYYPGGDLSRAISLVAANGGYFHEGQVVDVALGIAEALKYCHSRKLLHRDLNPRNVLLQTYWNPLGDIENPRVYVSDFGLSAVVESLSSRSADECGTDGWKAPEVERQGPHAKFGQKSDIYPLGLMLYKMCTLRLPNDRTNITPADIPSTYSNGLRDLISNMLKMSRDQRPTAAEVVSSLRSLKQALRSLPAQQPRNAHPKTQAYEARSEQASNNAPSQSRRQNHSKRPARSSFFNNGSYPASSERQQ